MRVEDFDFELPESLIALRPVVPRDAARMLVITSAALVDAKVSNLSQLLMRGDVLVVNDTAVIPARLMAERQGRDEGAPAVAVELLLHRRLSADRWRAFARPAKRLRLGDELTLGGGLAARVESPAEDGQMTLRFNRAGAALDGAVTALGAMPLPPYIAGRRPADERDRSDYQTVYARQAGAVAAPTAGLHFTPSLLAALESQGISIARLTLHVGAGTFLPVRAADTADHVMHAEWGSIGAEAAETINQACRLGGRIVAVGTTALRLLETAADDTGRIHPFAGETDIFITPGYRFRTADLLLTNFHLPRSTLVMLVQAFGGVETLRRAYAHAIAAGYRFYSYGDACLIERSVHG